MYFNTLGTIIANKKSCDSVIIRKEIDRIKEGLISSSIGSEEIVGLALPRTEYILITVMALLESGIPFLAIDLKLPKKRINLMLNNAGIQKIVTSTVVDEEVLAGYECLYIETEKEGNTAAPDTFRSDLAYIIHTSGSTGQPKAVEVTKEGLACFLSAMPEKIPFISGKTIACLSDYTFDIFFLEAVLALSKGLTVVIANEEEQSNPKRIIKLIEAYDIKLLQMTPSKMKLIWLYDKELACLDRAEAVMLGGEAFPKELFTLLKRKKNLSIYNLYGPTETTVWSGVSDLTQKEKIDLGKPLSYVRFYLLDEDLQPVATGETGEIYIGGSGVAKGYLNNEEQTSKHFINLPLVTKEKIYKTGDLACYDEEGALLFMGRKDNQVKLRGHRIELEEIDANVMKLTGIRLAVTCFDSKNQDLVTFYISESYLEPAQLKEHLSGLLPKHMVPERYYRTDNFNYTNSGKVDRRNMLIQADKYSEALTAGKDNIAITKEDAVLKDEMFDNATLCRVIEIINDVLKDKTRELTINDSLSELGLNSISYVDVIVRFEDTFDIIIGDDKLYLTAFANIGELTEYIDSLLVEKNISLRAKA